MLASTNNNAPVEYIDRQHSSAAYVFILTSIAMCITVDILQYSMPLAFLPSVLEDRGHSPEMIATAIGVYYWTGLLGGLVVTSYEVGKMLYKKEEHGADITPFATVKSQIKAVIFCLGIGVITLFIQANNPRWWVHTSCRFVQGFVGAFLFFYVFLLCVAVFKGQQQVIAMTCASCATVLAELAGPLLGSYLFDIYGQGSVFWFLGVVSFLNQGMLVICLFMITPTTDVETTSKSPLLHEAGPDEAAGEPQNDKWWLPKPAAWERFKIMMKNPTFMCANLIICMSGVIKGSVEEMLPFHADHQWGYDPLTIGKLFCTTAVSYFMASAIVASIWTGLGRFRFGFSSQSILLLGVSAWMSFHVAYYYKDETALWSALAIYGFCAGLAFTAAAQLIAEVVDSAEGHEKDAANGIWNTAWEAGGSSGFALGGFLAHRYHDQMTLTTSFMVCSLVVAISMAVIGGTGSHATQPSGKADKEKAVSYGSTA